MSTQVPSLPRPHSSRRTGLAVLVLPACSLGVDGNGQRTQEDRDLHDFSSVIADGSLDVQNHQPTLLGRGERRFELAAASSAPTSPMANPLSMSPNRSATPWPALT